MQTTRRPVPSVAALKALRQLAYIASGTACGAAALVYEARRRRILFLKKVAQNGRIIQDVARRSRNGYTTAAAVAAVQANDEYQPDFNPAWSPPRPRRTSQHTLLENDKTESDTLPLNERASFDGLSLRNESLPSQVEQRYEGWNAHREQDTAETVQNGRAGSLTNAPRDERATKRHPPPRNADVILARNHALGRANNTAWGKLWAESQRGQASVRAQNMNVSEIMAEETLTGLEASNSEQSHSQRPQMSALGGDAAGGVLKILAELVASTPLDALPSEVGQIVSRSINSGDPLAAIQVLERFTAVPGISQEILYHSWQAAARAMIRHHEIPSAAELLTRMRSMGIQSSSLIQEAWKSCSTDLDFLDMYTAFQLKPLPPKHVLSRLFHAMLDHSSSEVIASELIGQNGRTWSAVLSREWGRQQDARIVYETFKKVQNAIGKRLLSSVLYETAMRRCKEHGLKREFDDILAIRQELAAERGLSRKLSVIMHLAQEAKWDAVMLNLHKISPGDFGALQTQARGQLFDSLIRAFLNVERDSAELLEFGITIFGRVYEYTTPTQALRLLANSLARIGRLDALAEVHRHANELLERPLQLTSVDSADLFRSFYYGFRPSHVTLAKLMDKIYATSWQSMSRLHLPLLMVSATYEKKHGQQKGIADRTHDLIKDALLQIDNEAFQGALLLQARRSSAFNGVRSLDLGDDLSETQAANGMQDSLEKLLGKVSASGKSHKLSKEAADAAETTSQRYRSSSPREDDLSPPAILKASFAPAKSMDSVSLGQPDAAPPKDNANGYFAHAMTKALLHNVHDVDSRMALLFQELGKQSAFAPSATLAALVGMSSTTDSNDIRDLLHAEGSDDSLRRGVTFMASLRHTKLDPKTLAAAETIHHFKGLVTKEYHRMERSGHVPDHSLAASLAQVMLKYDQPGAAVEIIRHALGSQWGAVIDPGSGLLSTLLKSYIAAGHLDGVKWVVARVMTHDVRIERSFLRALKDGHKQWAGQGTCEKSTTVDETLAHSHQMCAEQQARQIVHAREVGDKLVAYIAKHAAPPGTIAWAADDDFAAEMAQGDVERQRYRDAVFVHSVCADVLTLARQGHQPNKRHNAMDLRLVRAMKRAEHNREMRGPGIEVKA